MIYDMIKLLFRNTSM